MGRYYENVSRTDGETYDPDDEYFDDDYDEEYEEEAWDEEGAEEEAEEDGDDKKNEAAAKPAHADPVQELQIVDKTRAAKDQKQKQQQPAPKAAALSAEERARFEAVKAGLAEHGIRDAPKTLAAAEKLLDELTSKEEAYAAAVVERKRRQGRAIEELPEEVWGEIVGYLQIKSLMMAGLSSQWLKYVVETSPTVTSAVAHTHVDVTIETEKKRDERFQKKVEKMQQDRRKAWRWNRLADNNGAAWYETTMRVEFTHTADPSEAVPLKFPWDGFNSVRYHILEHQALRWQDEDKNFENRILKVGGWRSVFDEKCGGRQMKFVKEDPNPEGTAKRRKLVDKMLLRTQELLRGVELSCWMHTLREIEFKTDSDDPSENPLVLFARAKCNAAAGMGNTAVALSEQLPEKPWEHPLVDKTVAKTFDFPFDGIALYAFQAEMRGACQHSVEGVEEVDVTLAPRAELRGEGAL